jgi:AraC-like DNA-binding protein
MTVSLHSEEIVRAGELVALIARQAVTEGPTHPDWPGLTFYRFEQRITPRWDEVGSVSLCMVAQGRKRVRIDSVDYFYDPFHYLVMTRGLRFQAEILQASPECPFFSFVLQMQPDLVTEVYDSMNRLVPDLFRIETMTAMPDAYVTALDQPLVGAVQRFLFALESIFERNVLAPMYLREIVYRLLRAEQRSRLLERATREVQGNAVTAAISFMKQEMHRPLTVRDLANAVTMSESAFAHVFKATTGAPPLQFLKQLRMEQASRFLLSGANVSEAADSVGYASLSHFISEFKRYFGEPPRTYSQRLRNLQAAAAMDASSGA